MLQRRGVMILLVAASVCLAEAPMAAQQIVRGPTVRKTVAGYEIAFTVDKATDATVRIVDAEGNVVRHLASGMVGLEKAAIPLAPNSLQQRITWDGKDDSGKPAPAGCKISVAVGMNAKFDRFLLWEPHRFIKVGDISVNTKGELYMVNGMGVHYANLRVFDREGKYLRCEFPFSPATKGVAELYKTKIRRGYYGREGVYGRVGMLDYEGNEVPKSINHSAAYFMVVHSHGMAVNSSGAAIGNVTWGGPSFWRIKEGLPYAHYLTQAPWVREKSHSSPPMDIAAAPDGSFYVVDQSKGLLAHVDEDLKPVKSIDGKYLIQGFSAPTSVAVDGDGNILVCDKDGISVFDGSGKELAKLKQIRTKSGLVPATGHLGVNSRTGAVYLNNRKGKLLKLRSFKEDATVAELHVSRPYGRADLAVDSEAGIVWVANGAGRGTLLRVKDEGDSLRPQKINGRKKGALVFPRFLAVGGDGVVYTVNAGYGTICRSDIEGKGYAAATSGVANMSTGFLCSDGEGNLYLALQRRWGEIDTVEKFGPDGKKLKFGDRDSIALEDDVMLARGMAVDGEGSIYVAVHLKLPPGKKRLAPGKYDPNFRMGRIDVYGSDGNLKKKGAVRLVGPNGVAVGRDGSIYTVEAYANHGAQKVARHWNLHGRGLKAKEPEKWWYSRHDKLLKFPASGGQQGETSAEWSHDGVSGTAPYGCAKYECAGAQVTVDEDDRIWCHDACVYNVKALDAAGNVMLRVGVYGNEDCKGGGGDRKLEGTDIVIDPEIPLARPSGVAVWKDVLLITDEFSGRIVRCRLEFEHKKETVIDP